MTRPSPLTAGVEVIHDEVMRFIKYSNAHPDQRILLASIRFADEEGVARFRKAQLQDWLAPPGRRRATASFVDRRIEALIEAGALAPGSTATELRSMIAHCREGEDR